MGTGTTLKVATENGYKAIGIEMDEQYCEIAAKSLSSTSVPLFTMPMLW
jgi:DNA modification methylase